MSFDLPNYWQTVYPAVCMIIGLVVDILNSRVWAIIGSIVVILHKNTSVRFQYFLPNYFIYALILINKYGIINDGEKYNKLKGVF